MGETIQTLQKVSQRLADCRSSLEAERDRLIDQARQEKIPWEQICKATGLARPSAYKARQRYLNS